LLLKNTEGRLSIVTKLEGLGRISGACFSIWTETNSDLAPGMGFDPVVAMAAVSLWKYLSGRKGPDAAES
jgi:hypothetical protein